MAGKLRKISSNKSQYIRRQRRKKKRKQSGKKKTDKQGRSNN